MTSATFLPVIPNTPFPVIPSVVGGSHIALCALCGTPLRLCGKQVI